MAFIFLYIILVGFGWLNIFATSKTEENHEILDFSTKYGKQILWISLSVPLIISILFFNSNFMKSLQVFYTLFLSFLYSYFSPRK
ncbi:hypothetical protein BST83_00160 [Polaribacter filamentus]|uniref:Uncharacterized protein n=1 Tax=Polaribacter filamentus TaxID=53483 RepID=A0A2S7L1M4_9FLAO|nr:hypothetical protein BST83_00160 [Polaribacter filamentus]